MSNLDYIGKLVYGYSLGRSPDRWLAIRSFARAKAKLKRLGVSSLTKLIQHQDRGTPYTSADYITGVLDTGAGLSYSKAGEPGDNAVNEAFFSRFKQEWRDELAEVENFEELEKKIKRIIYYYNQRRYHTSINNLTPLEFTKNQAKTLSR